MPDDGKTSHRSTAMLDALQASGPDPALAEKLSLYGRFVGSWRVDIDYTPLEGATHHAEAEWHFGWVLDGRAVQDVWIFPARHLRGGGKQDEPWFFYGSTIRIYDPGLDAWHIRFFEPTRPFEIRQTGRAVGADIVQLGEEQAGITRRWSFVEITERSFRWLGEASLDQGRTWILEMEMRARRAG
jgi:hypothetical protein